MSTTGAYAREESVKRFERSNGLDTALYKTIPLPLPLSSLASALSLLRGRLLSSVGSNPFASVSKIGHFRSLHDALVQSAV